MWGFIDIISRVLYKLKEPCKDKIEDIWNLPPEVFLDVTLNSKDFERTVVMVGEKISFEEYLFSNLYPGNYTFKVNYRSFTVEEPVSIPYEDNRKSILFPAVFNVSATVFDARGSPLKDVKVVMSRGGKEINVTTDDNGNVLFSIPPGSYNCNYYFNEELIAKRKVDVLTEKAYSVVTTNEPIFPIIIIVVMTIFFIGVGFISYRKKNLGFFLKIFAITLAIIAIVSPWWGISGSSSNSHLETSTKLYLVPTEMATITSNNNVTAGELSSLDERFTSVIGLFPIMISISIIFILANLILIKYNKRKTSFLAFLLALLFVIGSNVVFFYAMSQLAEITVGNFFGSGNVEFSIPGENMYETISSSWGPDIGFYLLFGAAVVLILGFCLYLKDILTDKIKNR